MTRRILGALVAALALLLTALAVPAMAAPSAVGPPWVKASSPTTLTVDWNGAKGSSRYEVLYSTTYDGALSSSAKSRKTSGTQTELKLTGLKPATMYCITVRGLSGSSKGTRASRNCRFTMRRSNDTSLKISRVGTYNICAQAGPCAATWDSRVDAIVARIAKLDVDVLAVQETSGRIDDMQALLAPLGFELGSPPCGAEAVFYRTAVWERVDDLTPPAQSGCRDTTQAPQSGGGGSFYLGNQADAAWTRLALRSNGAQYVFVGPHLTAGKTSQNDSMRNVETKSLVAQIKTLSPAPATRRVIIAGDFNSHRHRADDTPRKVLNAEGWHDTYDRSSTFTNPRYNSYTGYGTTPTTSNKYGDHVDHVFVKDQVGSTTWRVQQEFVGGRYATPVPSDHSPVRVTLYLS